MEQLTKLFEPITIGPMHCRNRIVMEGISLITEDTAQVGYVHQKYIDYYEERARGGVGLIILGDTLIERKICMQSQFSIEDDEAVPGLSDLADTVHMWGAKVAPDLCHFGYRIDRKWCPLLRDEKDWQPISSSPLEYEGVVAKEMDLNDIRVMEENYANAAVRARRAGFDAIQLAGQFGFLIAQFLSPRFNKRTDKYGGSLDNRMRFAIEIVERIKDKIGDSLPIIFRISADEFIDGGLSIEDTKIISKRMQNAGIDILNIIAGLDLPGKLHLSIFPMGFPQGPFVNLGAQIKNVVDIPVIIAGRITSPQFAEQVLADGKADMVGMARQLNSDPEWASKAVQGRLDDIVPCIGCNVCIQRLIERRTSRCSVNAAVGREREMRIVPAAKPSNVMVVGGGPAGLEAARVAALRGHSVKLYEKTDKLGGQLLLSTKPPHKDEIKQFMDYQVSQIVKLDIDTQFGVEVTAEEVEKVSPDVVIVATGALPNMPDIQGIDSPNVVTAWEVLAGRDTGERVVIAGGGLVGCETAEYLIEKGKKVTIVEMLPELALDVEMTNRSAMLERFENYDIAILTDCKVEGISDNGVMVDHCGDKKVVPGDTNVIAVGAVAHDVLSGKLYNKGKQVYAVGDCAKPSRIVDAINQASFIARKI